MTSVSRDQGKASTDSQSKADGLGVVGSRTLMESYSGNCRFSAPCLEGETMHLTDPLASRPLYNSVNDDGHFSLVRNFRLADCVTIMNAVCGSLSVFNSGKYLLTSNQSYLWLVLL